MELIRFFSFQQKKPGIAAVFDSRCWFDNVDCFCYFVSLIEDESGDKVSNGLMTTCADQYAILEANAILNDPRKVTEKSKRRTILPTAKSFRD